MSTSSFAVGEVVTFLLPHEGTVVEIDDANRLLTVEYFPTADASLTERARIHQSHAQHI